MFEPWSPHDEPGRPFDGWVEPCACVDCEAAIRRHAERNPAFVIALKTGCDRIHVTIEYLVETMGADPGFESLLYVDDDYVRSLYVPIESQLAGRPAGGRSPGMRTRRRSASVTFAGRSPFVNRPKSSTPGAPTGPARRTANFPAGRCPDGRSRSPVPPVSTRGYRVSVPSSPATEVFDPGEIPYEVWDGEVVVKGQPSRWHEAVRAEVLHQLLTQLTSEFVVLTSSAVGDDNTYAQSDGSLLALGSPEGAPPLLWIEVFSESDLRRREGRLSGRRRSWFLSQHSVATVAAFVEVYGAAFLHVFEDGRDPQSFSSPAKATLTLHHDGGELPVTFDLAVVADSGRRAEGD